MTAALKRRINDLEQMKAAAPTVPRLIVLSAPGDQVERLSDGVRSWQREADEDHETFLVRVEADLGNGPPVLLAASDEMIGTW